MNDHHNHDHRNRHDSGSGVTSLLFGIAVGAAVAYLFANKDGQKIRDTLLKEGQKILDEVSTKIQEVEKSDPVQAAKEQLESKLEDVKGQVSEIEQMVGDVPEHIEQIQKKGRRFFFHKPRSHAGES